MAKEQQQSFIGGMSRRYDPTRIDRSKYPLLVNGRNRSDTIRPVKKPLRIDNTSNLPTGEGKNFQTIFSAGSYLLAFIDGKAYYKDFNYPSSSFNQIKNFQMDSGVSDIFAELVPASTLNFERKLVNSVSNDITNIVLSSVIPGSASAIVVQDGKTQPFIINSQMEARESHSYDEWVPEDREFIPIGRQMMHHDGVLYIVSQDKKRLLRSVSGRPVDFVINVDVNGNKNSDEAIGGADPVSHAVDYEDITNIARMNSDDGGFFVSTARNSWKVIPLYNPEDLVFGEPTFRNVFLFSTGAKNHKSFIELLGDSALVDFSGLRSFNAVENYQVEGKNSPFSLEIADIFDNIEQTDPAAIVSDNYGFFKMNTIYGECIVIYDTITSQFVCLDKYDGIASIKQFAEVKTDVGRKLFFLTTDGKLYEAFAGNTVEKCKIYVGEWTASNAFSEIRVHGFKIVLSKIFTSGTIYASLFVDGKEIERVSKRVVANSSENVESIEFPFGDKTRDQVQNLRFEFKASLIGWKCGFWIDLNGVDAIISHVGIDYGEKSTINSNGAASLSFDNIRSDAFRLPTPTPPAMSPFIGPGTIPPPVCAPRVILDESGNAILDESGQGILEEGIPCEPPPVIPPEEKVILDEHGESIQDQSDKGIKEE